MSFYDVDYDVCLFAISDDVPKLCSFIKFVPYPHSF